MEEHKDWELVEDYIKKGDEKSLQLLFERYLKPIYGFVCRFVGNSEDANDLSQEIFIKVWRNLKKFDKDKIFKTWIFAVAKNTAIDFLKKKKAIPFSEFENEENEFAFADTLADPSPLPREILERADADKLISSAVQKLSLKYQAVLFLYYTEQFNFREIAESLGESLNTVKSRHRRALVQLKKILEEQEIAESSLSSS